MRPAAGSLLLFEKYKNFCYNIIVIKIRNKKKKGIDVYAEYLERACGDIVLTTQEISKVYYQILAQNGCASLEYYIDALECDNQNGENDAKIKKAKELMKDTDACHQIWQDFEDVIFYESGNSEYTVCDKYVECELGKDN